jgi:hypothetical protein
LSDKIINECIYDQVEFAKNEVAKDKIFDLRAEIKGASADKLIFLKKILVRVLQVLLNDELAINGSRARIKESKT